jgi:RNA polymerase sigma-B factor
MATLSPIASPLPPRAEFVDPSDPVIRAERLLDDLQTCADPHEREAIEEQVVLLTLGLADSSACRYRGRGIDHEDLVQVARVALVKAVRGYRPGRGHGFAAYAMPTILGELKRHFRDCGWAIRPPRRLQEIRGQVRSQTEVLVQELHREPTVPELAKALGVNAADVDAAQDATWGYHTTSLDSGPGEAAPLHVADPCDDYAKLLEHDALRRAVAQLSPRERHILKLRFVDELTQLEIGERIGVSQMQVSRLLSSVLNRLRSVLEEAEFAA